MSAPTVERTRATRTARPAVDAGPRQASPRQGAPRQAGAGRSAPRRATGAARPRETRESGGAVGRAYARRAGRERRLVGETGPVAARRSQFVLLIMGLLGIGLIASLWLSTTAAADSYRLDSARQATRDLSERSESLRADIASMQAAPSLARAAQEMGMVQVSDVARLVVTPDGSIRVVGTPKAAAGAPRPAPVLAAPAPQPGQQPAGQPGQQAQQAPGQQEPGLQAAGPTQQVPTQQAPSQQEPSQQVPAQQAPTQRTSIQPQRLAAPAGLAH